MCKSQERIQSIKMILPRGLSTLSKRFIKLTKYTKGNLPYGQKIDSVNSSGLKLLHNQSQDFTVMNKITVPPTNSPKNDYQVGQIKDKIETMYLKLNQKEELQQLQRIIYPEALLSGQQDISKLSKLYDLLINRFEKETADGSGLEQLIKAGDFYMRMKARRLKALKPYQKAKQMMQSRNLQNTPQGKQTYSQLCDKIGTIVKQEIVQGECSGVQQYFKKGLQQQRQGNQLQAIYYFHKGLCISEYRGIPNKLLHFNLYAHYIFLSQVMRPLSKELKQGEQFREGIEKYDQLEELANKWWNSQFAMMKDCQNRREFEKTMIWVYANKGDIYFRARKYQDAVKYYQKVFQFRKVSRYPDQRLKIIKIVQNLQKSYERLGHTKKAQEFLEWAHDFVKLQIQENPILKSRYLKPIDEMLIAFYQKNKRKDNKENFTQRIDKLSLEIKEIIS